MNGIGGSTIAEAQECISASEFNIWLKFRKKYGGLNPVLKTEWAAALVSSVIANVNRGKDTPPFKVSDFAPHINEPTLSLEDAMKQWN
ncbi:TPA: phage tail protein [Klebsiella michiganensis]